LTESERQGYNWQGAFLAQLPVLIIHRKNL